MAWVNYYRSAGFRVIAPNGFAELREPDVCGVANEKNSDNQTRNLKLRVAQTLRTIAGIKKKYPGEPLYLHGHSEGGYVVQALGKKVDGIIVSGAPCGFGYAGVYRAAKGVPLLLIAGTKDYAFPEASSAKALARFCRGVRGSGPMTFVSVAGMDHLAGIWWGPVQNAVSKFLNIFPVKIVQSSGEGVAYPKIPSIYASQYLRAPQFKAIAANKAGSWASSTESGSKLDAEEAALFGCDQAAGADAYLDSAHMAHICMTARWSKNGKKLVK
jgi:hypothetical protein